jgi:hypothetical protein
MATAWKARESERKLQRQGRIEGGGRTGGCLDGSYPNGTLQVVRRGRTNLQARQELDLRAGAVGRWLPVW